MAYRLEDFQKFRDDLNEEILGCGHLGMKRFFALDHQAYEGGLIHRDPKSPGGYAWAVDDWTRLDRFLVLGSEGGSYYATERALTAENASAVLRCDDCITYHLVRCGEEGWRREEVIDALNVALIVGGSITIPHVRRAFARLREIKGLHP